MPIRSAAKTLHLVSRVRRLARQAGAFLCCLIMLLAWLKGDIYSFFGSLRDGPKIVTSNNRGAEKRFVTISEEIIIRDYPININSRHHSDDDRVYFILCKQASCGDISGIGDGLEDHKPAFGNCVWRGKFKIIWQGIREDIDGGRMGYVGRGCCPMVNNTEVDGCISACIKRTNEIWGAGHVSTQRALFIVASNVSLPSGSGEGEYGYKYRKFFKESVFFSLFGIVLLWIGLGICLAYTDGMSMWQNTMLWIIGLFLLGIGFAIQTFNPSMRFIFSENAPASGSAGVSAMTHGCAEDVAVRVIVAPFWRDLNTQDVVS
jgi:hypothetical protein